MGTVSIPPRVSIEDGVHVATQLEEEERRDSRQISAGAALRHPAESETVSTARTSGPGVLARLGTWTATHLRAVLLVWLVVVGVFGVFAVRVEHALAGAGWQDSSSQSVKARQIVQRDFAGLGSTALQVVVVDHNAPIASSPAGQQVVTEVAR